MILCRWCRMNADRIESAEGDDIEPLTAERDEWCRCDPAPSSIPDDGVQRSVETAFLIACGYTPVTRRGACGHTLETFAHFHHDLCRVCFRNTALGEVIVAGEVAA